MRLQKRVNAGFTLIELLVVISIISLLISILLPALSSARQYARTMNCLSNMRNMQVAHWMFMTDNDGRFINVGLAHGGAHANEQAAWINTLSDYYGNKLLARSPVDSSPHWPGGAPVPGSADQYRRTSFGVNNYLTQHAPFREYRQLDDVPRPTATVQFLIMAYEGSFAGSDHTHVENWMPNPALPPFLAANQVQTNAHGGPPQAWTSKSNYGFLGGHAMTLEFQDVFRNWGQNRFDPEVAR